MRRMIIIAGMIWLGWLQVPCGAEKIVLQLKPSEVRQEIDGFGASGAWWAQIIGGWEESKRKEIAMRSYACCSAKKGLHCRFIAITWERDREMKSGIPGDGLKRSKRRRGNMTGVETKTRCEFCARHAQREWKMWSYLQIVRHGG